jgi:outer membrane lipoprotein SlyB
METSHQVEGAVAGAALGGLAGALVGWEVPKDRAIEYETQVKAGKCVPIETLGLDRHPLDRFDSMPYS